MTTLIGEIIWYRGDSYPMELTINNAETSLPIDIDGYSFILTVDSLVAPPDDSTVIFEVPGVLDADPSTGKVTFTPTSTQTDITPATYFYDVQMTDGDGNIRTIVKDKWKLKQDITK